MVMITWSDMCDVCFPSTFSVLFGSLKIDIEFFFAKP